jgi:ketosteroid isomerase-like protein
MDRIVSLDFLGAFGMLSLDGKYVVIGTTPLSRVYNGRDDLLSNLVPALSGFKVAPQLQFDMPIIEGDRVVLLGKGSGEGPRGPYDQPYYAFVMRIRGEEISEIIEFMDTGMLESAVFGKRLTES